MIERVLIAIIFLLLSYVIPGENIPGFLLGIGITILILNRRIFLSSKKHLRRIWKGRKKCKEEEESAETAIWLNKLVEAYYKGWALYTNYGTILEAPLLALFNSIRPPKISELNNLSFKLDGEAPKISRILVRSTDSVTQFRGDADISLKGPIRLQFDCQIDTGLTGIMSATFILILNKLDGVFGLYFSPTQSWCGLIKLPTLDYSIVIQTKKFVHKLLIPLVLIFQGSYIPQIKQELSGGIKEAIKECLIMQQINIPFPNIFQYYLIYFT